MRVSGKQKRQNSICYSLWLQDIVNNQWQHENSLCLDPVGVKTEGAEENISILKNVKDSNSNIILIYMRSYVWMVLTNSQQFIDEVWSQDRTFQQHVELEHRRTWIEQQNEWWRTDHEEQGRYRGAQVYREQVYSEPVYRTCCVYKEHVVISAKFCSLGYYNRFYLYTLVPAEIGEFFYQDSLFLYD